ncbi:MAG: RNA-binding S4 domain-containing protein [Acidobacteriota bacterium]|nr:RNA-binding S4 domain-containing protein [Acidobacteriota bacterium]
MTGVRMDKWLWAARFFKTRGQAADACDLGRVESNGVRAKCAREVKVGDSLRIRTEGGEFAVEVLQLSEIRGPASVAQTLYRETDESRQARAKAAEDRKLMLQAGLVSENKPNKKDRRDRRKWLGQIHRF